MTSPLTLSLAASGEVLIESDHNSLEHLRSVQLRLPGAEAFGRSSVLVSLNSFLGSIQVLSSWPGDVIWAEDLRTIVTRAIEDLTILERVRSGERSSSEFVLEADWKGDLTDFQARDLQKLLDMRHGANFSVPGAGKTRVALAFFSALRLREVARSALVVAPKSAHESWFVETASSFENGRSVAVYSGGAYPEADIVLVNYERLPTAQRTLATALAKRPTLLILDEAHRMKRGAAGAYGSVALGLGPLAANRLILSGTPAPNGLSDLKSLMEFNWPGRGSRLLGYGAKAWDDVSINLSPLFTRTTKEELKLPPLDVVTRTVALPPLHREIYDALLGQLRNTVSNSEKIDDLGRVIVYLLMAATSPALLAVGASRYEPLQFRVPPFTPAPSGVLRSLLADLPAYEMSPKILEAVSIARANAEKGRKTIIWSTFVRNLSTIQSLVSDLGAQMVYGGTPEEDRADTIRRFRKDPDRWVLLSNPATLGEGVSLHHECHEAVYLDRDFAAGRFLQSIDRIHRLGLQHDEVTRATVLVADDTIDVLVAARLSVKLRWMSEVLDDSALRTLADLEEERETGGVLDASDAAAVWEYLGHPASK